MRDAQADLAIIGAGIVGLATAYQYTERHPDHRVIILEKEARIAAHQTGHNSGVLHSGIYYKPGSLKAKNCREGKKAMEAFCEEEGIDYEICGKVIVALTEDELPTLQNIYERGQANGVTCRMIGKAELDDIEPHTAGIAAIHVPESGIVNYRQVSRRLAERIQERGGEIRTKARAQAILRSNGHVIVETTAGTFSAEHLINCAGLYSDKVTRMTGQNPPANIVPFRGEYYELKPSAHHLCRGLIYPVPDPAFPFLGVHFTRMIEGGVECGPNAVLAFAREGYDLSTVQLRELAETLTYPGFLRLAAKYWKTGCGEMWRSISKRAFVRALQRLVPEIREEDLEQAPAGVRAQAVTPDGSMVDDFLIQEGEGIINVCNAPSPAATASLNIGKHIVSKLDNHLSN